MTRVDNAIGEPCGLSFSQLAKLTDEQVMAHVQAGHDDALAVLFDRYHRLVLSIALKILRDIGEAEDVTQTVFFQIFKASAQFDPSRGTTKMWLLQYAYHRSMNRRQYLNRRNFYDQESATSDTRNSVEKTASYGAGTMALEEVRGLVREGLESLNKHQRQTLEMAYFEGMSLRDIAEKRGESLGNVRHHYYRGLSGLRSFVSRGNPNGNGKGTPEFIRGSVDAKA
jgi:RNA polymerase sigma-70 factor (ECF subfamily)